MAPSDPVEAFVDVARSYCDLIEQVETLSRTAVLDRLVVLLPRLLELGVQLPSEEPSADAEAEEISYGSWRERFAAVNRALGDLGDYWTTMEVGGDHEPEVVNLPLADDLADIWRDLRGGLSLVDASGSVADAVWGWRFTFEIHWCAHAVEALRAVHAARTASLED